jgi:TctA family transporter
MAVIATGAFAGDRAIFDISIAIVFGIFGYAMKVLNYSRSALLIGFVLGFAVEKNLYLALLLDGPLFVLQPIPMMLAMITVLFLGWNIYTIVRDRKPRISK